MSFIEERCVYSPVRIKSILHADIHFIICCRNLVI